VAASTELILKEAPWMAGVRGARANLIPGLILQLAILAILLGYYFHEPTHQSLERLAALKQKMGFGYAALSAMIAAALIPEIMRICVFQKWRIRSANLKNLVFTIPFWACSGMLTDVMFRTQAMIFGNEAHFWSVTAKVLCDQLIFTPLWWAPYTCWMYDWKFGGYRLQGCGRFFSRAYYRDRVLPVLIAGWAVWFPAVMILYSLPTPLQIPLHGLALSLWVLLYTWMSERRNGVE